MLGLAAGAVAVLAVVAGLLVISLPHSSHPAAAHGPQGGATSARSPSSSSALGGATSSSGSSGSTAGPASSTSGTAKSTHLGNTAGGRTATKTTTRAAAKGPSATGAGTPSSAPASTTPTTSAGATSSPAVDLPVPRGFGPLLRQIWVSADPGRAGLTPKDVLSTLPGSVYYAEQPAIGNYWAISGFVPTAQAQAQASTPAGKAILAQFGYIAVFNQAPGRGWAYLGSFRPGSCSPTVPAPVYTAWGLCQVGS